MIQPLPCEDHEQNDLIEGLMGLHRKVPVYGRLDRFKCEHCAGLCHSYEGLQCDDIDGEWPCETAKVLMAHGA